MPHFERRGDAACQEARAVRSVSSGIRCATRPDRLLIESPTTDLRSQRLRLETLSATSAGPLESASAVEEGSAAACLSRQGGSGASPTRACSAAPALTHHLHSVVSTGHVMKSAVQPSAPRGIVSEGVWCGTVEDEVHAHPRECLAAPASISGTSGRALRTNTGESRVMLSVACNTGVIDNLDTPQRVPDGSLTVSSFLQSVRAIRAGERHVSGAHRTCQITSSSATPALHSSAVLAQARTRSHPLSFATRSTLHPYLIPSPLRLARSSTRPITRPRTGTF